MAINSGGHTLVVLGTTLDEVYPKHNKDLQERIGDDHLLVSQYATGTPIQRKNFPLRTRTMALACCDSDR